MKNTQPNGATSTRLNTLLDALEDARKSLESWQDQRTQALINIDAFSYDVRLIEEEKNQVLEEYQKAQEVYHAREMALQQQISTLTEQMQNAAAKNESLLQELDGARMQTFAARAETEKQVHVQKIVEEKHQVELEKIKADAETRAFNSRKEDLAKIDQLTRNVQAVSADRERQEIRAKKAEQELLALRGQLQTALNQTPTQNPTLLNLGNTLSSGSSHYDAITGGNPEVSIEAAPAKPARELVQDYLKRLGY